MESLRIIFSNIKNILFSSSLKNQLMKILNIICLLVLFYNAIDMTFDYLSFNYSYKLIVDDNKEGFDLPEISVCTENNILFAKSKVIQYFDVENEWQRNVIEVKKHYIPHENERSEFIEIKETCIEEMKFVPWRYGNQRDHWIWRMNFCLNKFFKKYKRFIFNEMSFYEMNSLTINANELFECSANIYFRNTTIDKNIIHLDNCFDRLRVRKRIHANEDFGICYAFSEDNQKILMMDKNDINITLKFEVQKDFMIVNRSINYNRIKYNSLRYFIWYVMVRNRDLHNRETAIELNKVGFDVRISLEMTSIELLSTPYMTYCVNNGKHFRFTSNTEHFS